MKYRAKSIVVEARQYIDGNGPELARWCGGYYHRAVANPRNNFEHYANGISIPTPEGRMHATPGDWIIRSVKGEFYPCKPDIFEATFERVSWMAGA